MPDFETLTYEVVDHVATVTMNRPEKLNAFNAVMQHELRDVWRGIREDDDVHVAILTGAGDKAFCTGIDRDEAMGDAKPDRPVVGSRGTPFHFDDPGSDIGPKSNDLWKPVIAAVNGIACGGAFYMLGEVDFIIAVDHATFFDPHVTYGMAASFESMHILQKAPLGEVLRMQLLGAHERLSAQRAYEIGLVSEVVPRERLDEATRWAAAIIAAQPPLAVQATVRAVWAANDLGRRQALDLGYAFVAMGTNQESIAQGQRAFAEGKRVEWKAR